MGLVVAVGTVLERAQLLEALALLEHAARQPDKAVEGLAPIGVEADMLVMRSLAPGYHRLAEIERAGRPSRVDKPGDDLVDAGIGERSLVLDQGGECRDVSVRVGEAVKCRPNRGGIQQRQIALDV